jgi:hypothetical protein
MASSTLAQACKGRAPDVVIGVDTHKDVHVSVALAPNGGSPAYRRHKGYDDLIVWSEEFGSNPVYAIEGSFLHTGGWVDPDRGVLSDLQWHAHSIRRQSATDLSLTILKQKLNRCL